MMRMNGMPKRVLPLAITATILTTAALAGCGTNGVPAPSVDSKTSKAPARNAASEEEEVPATTSPYTGEDVQTHIPQPIPNPAAPADPKALAVRAVANTINSCPLSAVSDNAPNSVSVYATITWSKCENAAQYRVSRNENVEDKDEKGNLHFYLRQNVPAQWRGYKDGGKLQPLKIDNKYTYLVEALDSSGKVIAKGQNDTTPLYPLPIPTAVSPEKDKDGRTIAPKFEWKSSKGASGYYVEVFSGVYFTPMWRGFRKDEDGTTIQYGEQVDFMPGTTPAIWTMVLNPQGFYTWSVTAVKTDSGNALTAKAWAKSNSPAWRFYCGAKPALGGN